MVEIKVKNTSDVDKIIIVARDPVTYIVPANGEIMITFDDPEKDSIVLES